MNAYAHRHTHTHTHDTKVMEEAKFQAHWETQHDHRVELRALVLQHAPLCARVGFLSDLSRIVADYAEPRCADARPGDGMDHAEGWYANCRQCNEPLCVTCVRPSAIVSRRECSERHLLCRACWESTRCKSCQDCGVVLMLCGECVRFPRLCDRGLHLLCFHCHVREEECRKCHGPTNATAVKRRRLSQ
jgi:hypothetical protein